MATLIRKVEGWHSPGKGRDTDPAEYIVEYYDDGTCKGGWGVSGELAHMTQEEADYAARVLINKQHDWHTVRVTVPGEVPEEAPEVPFIVKEFHAWLTADQSNPPDWLGCEWSDDTYTEGWTYGNLDIIRDPGRNRHSKERFEKNVRTVTEQTNTKLTHWKWVELHTEENDYEMNPTEERISFKNVPVVGHTRGLRVPVSPFQRGNADTVWNAPQQVKAGTIEPEKFYVAELDLKPWKDGFHRRFHSLQAVTEAEFNERLSTFEHELVTAGQRYMGQAQVEAWETAAPQQPEQSQPKPTSGKITNILDVPQVRPEFIPDTSLEEFCILLDSMAQVEGKPKNGMVLGVTAAGKTFGVEQAAAKLGRLFIRIDMSKVGEIYDLVGPMLAVEENGVPVTKWIPSAFIKAIQDPRPKWILLDELNRTQSPHALNFLMPLLDDSHRSYFDEGEQWVEMDPKTVIFATQNGDVRGNDTGDYVGTQPLDQAIVSRFPARVQVHYPPEPKIVAILQKAAPNLPMVEIKLIAGVATELAKAKYQMPNLRELIEAAKMRQMGKSLYQALCLTIGGLYPYNRTPDCPFMTFRATLQGKGVALDPLE